MLFQQQRQPHMSPDAISCKHVLAGEPRYGPCVYLPKTVRGFAELLPSLGMWQLLGAEATLIISCPDILEVGTENNYVLVLFPCLFHHCPHFLAPGMAEQQLLPCS